MATLAGQQIKNKYGNLLHIEGGLTSSLKVVEDGQGNDTQLSVSATLVGVGALRFTSLPASSTNETSALFVTTSGDVQRRTLASSAFTLPNIAGGSNVSVSGIYPNLTIDASVVFEETFIGYVPSDQTLESNGSDIVVFSVADNTDQQSSYHFGKLPAKLALDPTNGEYIENVSGSTQVIMVDMTTAVQSTNANRDISFTMVKFDGTNWVSQNGFYHVTHGTVPEAVSFWGVYILAAGERLRIGITSVAGGVSVKAGSLFRFIVKEVGDII